MQLVICMFSNLDSGGGGVETWLKLFLEEIDRNKSRYPVEIIHIYYYETEEPVNIIGTQYKFVNLHPIRIPLGRGLIKNFLIYLQFHRSVIKGLTLLQSKDKVKLVSIGSYPTGIFNSFLLKWFTVKAKVDHIIWLRTTLKKYIKTHKSSKFSNYILKLEKKALLLADEVIANGWDTKENYLNDLGVNSVVIPNAIDLAKYKSAKALNDIPGVVKVAFIGRFFENKGVFNFVNAIKIFNEKYQQLISEIQFLFVGWGDENVETFALNNKNCEFVGKVCNDKILSLLDTVHCGVALTKANENDPGGSGVSNALLELMSTGKVVLAYKNSIYQQFPEEELFVYVDENNDEEMADVFSALIKSKQVFFKQSLKAKNYSNSFSIQSHVAAFFELAQNIK